MNIIFRVDSSYLIGNGHVTRCLTLAEKLKSKKCNIMFISRDHPGNASKLIIDKNFKVILLKRPILKNKEICRNNYTELLGVSQNSDVDETANHIREFCADWIIIDHYSLDILWEKKIRKYSKNILVIDDMANRKHDCDILLDQNWFVDMEGRYRDLIKSKNCKKLYGPKYALLKDEFQNYRAKIKKNKFVERIFIFFGGADIDNVTEKIINIFNLQPFKNFILDVVIGINNPYKTKIKTLCDKRKRTNLYINVKDIASIMSKADFAIGAGGVNTWERMCLRLMSAAVSTSENQDILLKDLVRYKYILKIDNILSTDETTNVIMKGISNVNKMKRDNDLLKIIDGKGTDRVAKIINEQHQYC